MSRTFIYARVRSADQNTDNQIHEIEAAGFSVNQRRIVTESISGSDAASERPQTYPRPFFSLEPTTEACMAYEMLKSYCCHT